MNNTVLQEFVEQTYLDFLKQEEARELESIQKDYDKLLEQFSALAEYAQFDKLLEATTIDVEQLSKQVGTLKDIFGALASFAPKKAEFPEYAQTGPAPDMTLKPRAGDNIRMFLTSIITWIKNIVIRIIEFIKKTFARITGLGYTAPTEKATLNLNDILKKERQAFAMEKSFNSFGGLGYVNLADAKNRQMLNVADDKFKDIVFDKINVTESTILEDDATKVETKTIKTIYLDPSKDLFALREALNHFFKLFDESIGSNGERLFETTDIELLFKNFEAVRNALENGDTSAYADVGGRLSKLNIVSPDRIRDNLIRTKVNTDNLSKAYEETQKIITNVLQIIAQKNYQGSVLFPDTYRLLSSATYKQMGEIVKVLNNRLDDAKVLDKNLSKAQDKFTRLTKELESLRAQYMQLGSNYYAPSILQKEISDLFIAAKYVTQTIMLRFATLSLYMKVLSDTKEAMVNLNLINGIDINEKRKRK